MVILLRALFEGGIRRRNLTKVYVLYARESDEKNGRPLTQIELYFELLYSFDEIILYLLFKAFVENFKISWGKVFAVASS